MSPDPKTPELPTDGEAAPRRKYTTPRVKSLGSVRDLTLGSAGVFGEPGGMQSMPM